VRDDDFTVFASTHWASLFRTARLLGCTAHEAEDVTQTALVKCYVSWGSVARADNPIAYATRVLINTHRQSHRRRWWHERPTDRITDQASPVDDHTRADTRLALDAALDDLPAIHREVVVLRYYCDLSEQETAEVLSIKPGTVKSRLSRALAGLGSSGHISQLLPEDR
jgi:RNA polymerase sigma-70 factor (sigma-E family)